MLKAALERSNAGRLLLASLSVKGKGTTTTENFSKISIGFIIRSGFPFAQGAL
jgi:hypothetical protein